MNLRDKLIPTSGPLCCYFQNRRIFENMTLLMSLIGQVFSGDPSLMQLLPLREQLENADVINVVVVVDVATVIVVIVVVVNIVACVVAVI